MRILCTLLFLFICSSAYAGVAVFCDATTNAVTDIKKSVNTPDYDKDPNVIVNPDFSGVLGVDEKYWKCSVDSVVEMTTPEKNVVDAKNTKRLKDIEEAKIDGGEATVGDLIDALDALSLVTKSVVIDKMKELKGISR